MLFLNWRFVCTDTSDRATVTYTEGTRDRHRLCNSCVCVGFIVVKVKPSEDSLARHLTNPLFVTLTLFLSCLLLTVAFLPVFWFPWLLFLTGDDLPLGTFPCRSSRNCLVHFLGSSSLYVRLQHRLRHESLHRSDLRSDRRLSSPS